MPIEQQIYELMIELEQCRLTRHERRLAVRELDRLRALQQR